MARKINTSAEAEESVHHNYEVPPRSTLNGDDTQRHHRDKPVRSPRAVEAKAEACIDLIS